MGRTTAVVVAGMVVIALAGCGRDYAGEPAASDQPAAVVTPSEQSDLHGVELQNPIEKAAGVFTDTSAADYDFCARTAGRLTLVYAGYTHCPDVCPTTVADVAAALRGLAPQQRAAVDVVMFSTDPERDTPKRMRAWLDQFDPDFAGLTGTPDQLIGAVNEMGINVEPPQKQRDGSVIVEHGAQVLAFAPDDDRAHVLWTSGTSASEFRDDIEVLLTQYGQGTTG